MCIRDSNYAAGAPFGFFSLGEVQYIKGVCETDLSDRHGQRVRFIRASIVIAPFLCVLAKADYVKGGERHRGKASKPCCISCCIRCEKGVFECNTHATRGVSILTLE